MDLSCGLWAGQFADSAFDVAFDKGGLDALMGDEGDDADTAGALQQPGFVHVPSSPVSSQHALYIH